MHPVSYETFMLHSILSTIVYSMLYVLAIFPLERRNCFIFVQKVFTIY